MQMDSALPKPSGGYSIEAIRESLKGHADYMEQKFDSNKAADIKPKYLNKILNDLKALKTVLPTSERNILSRIRKIENLCYAAQSIYSEPQNRSHYFEHLRIIAPLLNRV
jgi:hypothetical protein